jgi:cobalamin synthase
MQGVILALLDRSLSSTGLLVRSAVIVAVALALSKGIGLRGLWRTLSRRPSKRRLSVHLFATIFATLALLLELYCLSRIGNLPSRGRALVLAMMLSRWSVVPLGYGLRVRGSGGLGIQFDGAITFRHFAISSVIALGLALTAYDFVGLIVIVMLAFTILGLRFIFSRILGGVDGYALGAGTYFCELGTIAVLCVIQL